MANPTAQEQELLELVNRLRTAPQPELDLLLNSPDPIIKASVDKALQDFGVNLTTLRNQWSSLQAVAPLAWSSELNDAAAAHNLAMFAADVQAHQVPGEKTLGERVRSANYQPIQLRENTYGFASSVFYAEASLAIDWGMGPDGIQNPPEHRQALLATDIREAGLAVTAQTQTGKTLGQYAVTQDFGNREALAKKGYVLGVTFEDANNDTRYQAGEGITDAQIKITGVNGTNFSRTLATADAGGYQALLDSGRYQVDFIRNGTTLGRRVTTIDSQNPTNVKLDLVLPVVPLGSLQNAAVAGSNALDFQTDVTQGNLNLAGKKLDLSFGNVSADAAYHNYGGIYRVEDDLGTVIDPVNGKSYQPGDTGYITAALRRSQQENGGKVQLDNQNTSSTPTFTVDGGYRYGAFIVADGTISSVLAAPDLTKAPHVYFNYVAANTDGKQHFQIVGNNTYAAEDTFNLSNTDYNDLIFQVNAKAVTVG